MTTENVGFRTSPSHQRYLDEGLVLSHEKLGKVNGSKPTMVHFYGPCASCGIEMHDVNDLGYEECTESPYTGSYYGPANPLLCVRCAHKGYVNEHDLTGRFAKCRYKNGRPGSTTDHTPVPSSWSLAFFEYQGDGSREATEMCGTCRYSVVAHGAINQVTKRAGITDHTFVPRGGQEFDVYYCGCWGWD